MSYNSKHCEIVKRGLINRTLLIEQCWVKSRAKVVYGKRIGKRDIEKIKNNSLSQT